jgi:hypothetical protein
MTTPQNLTFAYASAYPPQHAMTLGAIAYHLYQRDCVLKNAVRHYAMGFDTVAEAELLAAEVYEQKAKKAALLLMY